MTQKEQAQQFFHEGETYVCVENTYIPQRAGARVLVEKAGKSVCLGTATEGDKSYAFRLSVPTRAKDILAVSNDEMTYKIGRDEHTVTYRRTKFDLTDLRPGDELASYNEKVQTDSATFFRVGRRVVMVTDHATTLDEYADVAAAKFVLDMARED